MKNHYKYIILVIWMVAIFLLSNEASNISSGRSEIIVTSVINTLHINLSESVLTFLTRKSAHIFMYLVLGVLMYWSIRNSKMSSKKIIILSIILSLMYAIFDEVHQLFIPGRSGELRDVLIDTAASIVGIGLCYLYFSKRSKNVKELNNE